MEQCCPAVKQPIFLVGAERSGTTVLRLMLSHHPQIAWCAEFEYSVDWITDDGLFPPLNQYREWLDTHRIFQAAQFTIEPELTYSALMHSFLQQECDRSQKSIVGATVHRHFDRLLMIWPEARFIHIVRDPRNVASSCIGMGWAGNVWKGVDRWLEAESLWERLKPTLSPEQYVEISYEALIANSLSVLTTLCEFIGVPYQAAMLQYPDSTTYDAPDPTRISRWREKLAAQEVQLVETRTKDLLLKRGYSLSGLPQLKPSVLMRWKLALENWLICKKFRLERYGFPLILADLLTRRLNLRNWQKVVLQQLNQIDTLHLQ